MILGMGTDIIEIQRLSSVLERTGEKFAQRILTPVEMNLYNRNKQPVRLLAKRFAVKESVAKALGTGIGRGVSWQDIELYHDEAGKPLVKLSNGAAKRLEQLGATQCHVSISDERHYATAFAIIQ